MNVEAFAFKINIQKYFESKVPYFMKLINFSIPEFVDFKIPLTSTLQMF
jgi:hypothetical protein